MLLRQNWGCRWDMRAQKGGGRKKEKSLEGGGRRWVMQGREKGSRSMKASKTLGMEVRKDSGPIEFDRHVQNAQNSGEAGAGQEQGRRQGMKDGAECEEARYMGEDKGLCVDRITNGANA